MLGSMWQDPALNKGQDMTYENSSNWQSVGEAARRVVERAKGGAQ